jgi:hypothetical protein
LLSYSSQRAIILKPTQVFLSFHVYDSVASQFVRKIFSLREEA